MLASGGWERLLSIENRHFTLRRVLLSNCQIHSCTVERTSDEEAKPLDENFEKPRGIRAELDKFRIKDGQHLLFQTGI